MKIPKKIHFCGRNYSVKEQLGLDGDRNLGTTMLDKGQILIEEDIPQEAKEETFIHELLHIAYYHSGDILSHEDQEKIVKAWAKNIYGILKDNNLLK